MSFDFNTLLEKLWVMLDTIIYTLMPKEVADFLASFTNKEEE